MRTKQEIRHLLSQVHVGTFTKTDADIYFDTAKGTFYVSVIDGAGNRKNPMKDVRTIDDLLQKYRNQWQWTPQGKKFFANEI